MVSRKESSLVLFDAQGFRVACGFGNRLRKVGLLQLRRNVLQDGGIGRIPLAKKELSLVEEVVEFHLQMNRFFSGGSVPPDKSMIVSVQFRELNSTIHFTHVRGQGNLVQSETKQDVD